MGYKCVVLAKQVPDTKKITGQAMNDDGTVNRGVLPAIFNPEDLNALELALAIKEQYGGSVTVVTMGPPLAVEMLREALYRGADDVVLITDAKAAASDTLATSYILSCAVKRIGYDIVLCGRQAIDGDTAQVGPQLAEKLGVTQITYVEELIGLENGTITVRKSIGNGYQHVRADCPVLLTITGVANEPRVSAARKIMKYKNARSAFEVRERIKAENAHASESEIEGLVSQRCKQLEEKGLLVKQYDLDMLGCDLCWCGRDGSPTKVHRIQSVVLTAKENKEVEASAEGISDMIYELIVDKTIA